MATRRSRIKAVVNIPQRRKTETKPNEDVPETIDISEKVAETELPNNQQSTADSNLNPTLSQQEQSLMLDLTESVHSDKIAKDANYFSVTQDKASDDVIINTTLESSSLDKADNSLQKTLRRSFVKPKLNKRVLEKSKSKGVLSESPNTSKDLISISGSANEVDSQAIIEPIQCNRTLSTSLPSKENTSKSSKRLLVRPALNPKLLQKAKRNNTANGDDLSKVSVPTSSEVVNTDSITTESGHVEALIKDTVINKQKTIKRALIKPAISKNVLKKIKRDKCLIDETTSIDDLTANGNEEEVIDITNEPDDISFEHSKSTLVKPIINGHSDIKSTLNDTLPVLNQSTGAAKTNDVLTITIPQKVSNSTSCFDIIQADIVIPGAIMKDAANISQTTTDPQPLIIPAYNNELLDAEHLDLTDERVIADFNIIKKDIINNLQQSDCNSDGNSSLNDNSDSSLIKQQDDANVGPKNEPKKLRRPIIKPTINRKILSQPKQSNFVIENTINDDNVTPEITAKINTAINESCTTDLLPTQKDSSQSDLKIHNEIVPESSQEAPTLKEILIDLENVGSGKEAVNESKNYWRPFVKPTINKKLLTKIKQEVAEQLQESDSDINKNVNCTGLLQKVELNSQPDNELEVVSAYAEGEEDAFVKPTLKPKLIKTSNTELEINTKEVPQVNTEQTTTPSPIKIIGRSRIKAVPRLGQRRISATFHGSASESEDDFYKNYKRIRTESACSTKSTVENQINSEQELEKVRDLKPVTQRKCRRSEQSRKIAEARRSFMHKYGNRVPDKQKLTMMDLIYYNPTTKPMSQKPIKQDTISPKDETEPCSEPAENKENELATVDNDDDNSVPAPQIKIGLNGEIVIDEQSLIIENAQTRKSREELQKSSIVDGDFDTGYGIFKRVKRTKEWSNTETLYFYKALNTLGTDFTLMSEFFHNRTRRELKMKFKKEEKLNSVLIDRALSQIPQFGIDDLRQDFEQQKKLMQPDLEVTVALQETNDYLKRARQRRRCSAAATPKKRKKKKGFI